MGATKGAMTEIRDLKSEIAGLRTDLNRFIERANQQHVDAVLGDLKKNYGSLFTDHEIGAAKEALNGRMVHDCKMRDKCFAVFMEFLESTAQHIREGQVTDEIVGSYREQLKALRKKGPFDRCDTCFTEVSRLFERQVGLMESLGIYRKPAADGDSLADLPDDAVVQDFLEPLANIQRFQIIKALAVQTRTFSEISQLTGLRGGNLLFHIRKLTESGMILQRHERGDYIITEKGFRALGAISGLTRGFFPPGEDA